MRMLLQRVGLVAGTALASLVALEPLVRVTGLGVRDQMFHAGLYGRLLVDDEAGGHLRHAAPSRR